MTSAKLLFPSKATSGLVEHFWGYSVQPTALPMTFSPTPCLPTYTSFLPAWCALSWHQTSWLHSFYDSCYFTFFHLVSDYLLLEGKLREEDSHMCFATFRSAEPDLVSGTKLAFKFKYFWRRWFWKQVMMGETTQNSMQCIQFSYKCK